MAKIQVTCPMCNETLELDSQYDGQEVECGACFQTFVARGPSSRKRSRDRDDEEEDRRPARKSRRRTEDDYDDDGDYDEYAPPRRRVRRRRYADEGGNSAAVWSLVLGLLSLVFGFCCGLFSLPLSIGAMATGAAGMKKEQGRGMAVAGIVLGIIGLVIAIIMVVIGLGMNMNNPGQFKRGR
jgi:hypothetical protein